MKNRRVLRFFAIFAVADLLLTAAIFLLGSYVFSEHLHKPLILEHALEVLFQAGLIVFTVLPIITTVFITVKTIKKHRKKSRVNFQTYIDPSSLGAFESKQLSISRPIDGLSRYHAESMEMRDIHRSEEIRHESYAKELDDIPDYDPSGSSPFKKE